MLKNDLAKKIDHTLLKADGKKREIDKLCEEAVIHSFASVCVHPSSVKRCARRLKGTDIKVCTVIGFPLGTTTTATKAFETKEAVDNGATEVDMVINLGALKEKNDLFVEKDIRAVVEATNKKAKTKVIIETALLNEEEIVRACKISVRAGADYVKTSTGFSTGGATVEDVKLMRETVGPTVGVKASGGIRTTEDALQMIAAGASRIGASSGITIIQGLKVK